MPSNCSRRGTFTKRLRPIFTVSSVPSAIPRSIVERLFPSAPRAPRGVQVNRCISGSLRLIGGDLETETRPDEAVRRRAVQRTGRDGKGCGKQPIVSATLGHETLAAPALTSAG